MKLISMKRSVACRPGCPARCRVCPPTPTNGRRPTTSAASPTCGSRLPTPTSASRPGTRTRLKPRSSPTRYKIGEGGIRVEEHQTGDSVEIDVHYPHHNFNIEWGNGISVDIIIQMPREGRVNLRTGDGKIDIAGLKGEMDLHSGDGSENLEGSRRQTARLDRRRTHHRPRPLRRTRTQDRRWPRRRARGERVFAGRRLAARNRRWQRFARSPRRTGSRCGPAHQRRPHRSRHARSPRKARFGRTKSTASSTVAAALLTIRTGDGSIHLRKG